MIEHIERGMLLYAINLIALNIVSLYFLFKNSKQRKRTPTYIRIGTIVSGILFVIGVVFLSEPESLLEGIFGAPLACVGIFGLGYFLAKIKALRRKHK